MLHKGNARKRNFSSTNARNQSYHLSKRRKLNSKNDDNANTNITAEQMQSFREQLMAIKNKHGLNQNNNNNHKINKQMDNNDNKQKKLNHNIKMINNYPNSKSKRNKYDLSTTNKKKAKMRPKSNPKRKAKSKAKSNNNKEKKAHCNKDKQIKTMQIEQKLDNDQVVDDFLESDDDKIEDKLNEQNLKKSTKNNAIITDNDDANKFIEEESVDKEKDVDQDWSSFINTADFHLKTKTLKKGVKIKISDEIKARKDKGHNLSEIATATESDWLNFLDQRYDENEERNKDWVEPEINTFWDQGPIGIVKSWWDDNDYRERVGLNDDDYYDDDELNKKIELTKDEISKRKQNKMIKLDIMKELKQQKLEKRLRDRIKEGEVVHNLDSANNPFESFFDAAMEMGQNIRDGKIKQEEKKKEKKKTKIIKPKYQKLKDIATFENDDLFFFDESNDDTDNDSDNDQNGKEINNDDDINENIMANINENDMIHINENSIINSNDIETAIIASKQNSEQILLQQRLKIQREAMINDMNKVLENVKKSKSKKIKNNIVSSDILSNTIEDSIKEKKILKKLNVMDYVSNYKNAFFREVEELNLNATALVDNWHAVKTNEGISRKLRKKLGIIMARERAKRRKKECKEKQMMEMMNDMTNESSTDNTGSDGSDQDSDIESEESKLHESEEDEGIDEISIVISESNPLVKDNECNDIDTFLDD